MNDWTYVGWDVQLMFLNGALVGVEFIGDLVVSSAGGLHLVFAYPSLATLVCAMSGVFPPCFRFGRAKRHIHYFWR